MSVPDSRLVDVRTALYRRYRPETFEEVIGQEHVTVPLMAALEGDRTNHAYLFSGPRGCGKTTSARILARCLNCANGPTATPCGTCESCRDLSRSGPGSLDVVEMDAASHGGVDDARELRERASFAPARDRFKIFIIDEAHMVSNQGFNALLKLVEEPPEHVKFIFATTEPDKVIGTIRSRTHHYPFRLVPPDTLENYLESICAEEEVRAGHGVLPLVVRAGTGSVRDTLSVLDQLIGGATDNELDYERCLALLGYTDNALLDEAVDAIADRDGAGLYGTVDRVVSSGHDPRRFTEDLLMRLRDIVVLSLAGDAARDVLAAVPADQLETMKAQAEDLGPARASSSADLVATALSEMVGATSPRLQLELLCARLLVDSGGVTPTATIADPKAAARALGGREAKAKEAPAPAEPTDKKVEAPSPEAGPSRLVPLPGQQDTSDGPAQATPDKREEQPQVQVPEENPAAQEPADATAGGEPEFDEREDPAERVTVDIVGRLRSAWREMMQRIERDHLRTRELISLGQVKSVDEQGITYAFTDNQVMAEFHSNNHPQIIERVAADVAGVRIRVLTDPPQHPRGQADSDDQEGDQPVGPVPREISDDEPEDGDVGPSREPADGTAAGGPPPAEPQVQLRRPPEEPEASDSVIPEFAAVDLPPVPPAHFPVAEAGPVAPSQAKDFASLTERHGGSAPEPVEYDDTPEEEQVSRDDPMAIDTNDIGLEVVLDTLGGTVIEEFDEGQVS